MPQLMRSLKDEREKITPSQAKAQIKHVREYIQIIKDSGFSPEGEAHLLAEQRSALADLEEIAHPAPLLLISDWQRICDAYGQKPDLTIDIPREWLVSYTTNELVAAKIRKVPANQSQLTIPELIQRRRYCREVCLGDIGRLDLKEEWDEKRQWGAAMWMSSHFTRHEIWAFINPKYKQVKRMRRALQSAVERYTREGAVDNDSWLFKLFRMAGERPYTGWDPRRPRGFPLPSSAAAEVTDAR